MYRNKCNVMRAQFTKVGKSDDTTRSFRTEYEQIACHLGKAGKENEAHRDDTSEKLFYNLRLYCDPVYKIQPNDVLEVFHEGQTMKFFAGAVFEYPNHQEIECFRRLEAGQH